MARGAHWWSEPPLWAWIVMVVGAVAIAVLLPVALGRGVPDQVGVTGEPTPTASAPEASAGTTTQAAPTAAEPARAVLVIGEGDASGARSWPALLQDRLDTGIEVAADPGAGYVQTGPTGRVMADLVEEADLADAEVVVVFGSRNDGSGIADQVAVAAREVFDAISAAAPDAELVVVGPMWPAAEVPAGVRNNRDVIGAEAAVAGATFVDPLAEGWLLDEPGLVGDDGSTLTRAGQEYVADRIEPLLSPALAAG